MKRLVEDLNLRVPAVVDVKDLGGPISLPPMTEPDEDQASLVLPDMTKGNDLRKS